MGHQPLHTDAFQTYGRRTYTNFSDLTSPTLFAFPEVNHGIMPGLGGTITLSQLVGNGKATEMMLSGDIVNAEKAHEMNLVDYAVPNMELESFTMDYLDKLTGDWRAAVQVL